jgi:hypothetical protein
VILRQDGKGFVVAGMMEVFGALLALRIHGGNARERS